MNPDIIEQEMAGFDAEFPPHERGTYVDVPATEENRIGIKAIARERYQSTGNGGPLRFWARAAKLFRGADRHDSRGAEETDSEDIHPRDTPDTSQ